MTLADNVSQEIDLLHVNQYDILLCFAADGLSLLVYDQAKALLSSRNFPYDGFFSASSQEIIQLLAGVTEIRLNFKSLRLVCESERYTFVPVPFFKVEEAKLFLNFQQLLSDKEDVLYNRLINREMVTVFALPKGLHGALSHLFPNCEVEHHQSYFLTDKVKFTPESAVHVWVRDKVMDVVVLNNATVQLANSFSYTTPEDFTYYVLTIYENLSLNMEKDCLHLYNLKKRETISRVIEKYVKYVDCLS